MFTSSLLLSCALLVAAPLAPAPQAEAPAVRLHQALGAAQGGNAALALQLAKQLTADYPTYAPALKFEGALLEDLGDAEEARPFFEKALTLDPNDPELLFSVGVARLQARRYPEAATLLAKGTQLAPNDSQMFFYLAQAEHLTGNEEKALTAAGRSVQLEPANGVFLQKYGEYLSAAGNSREALSALQRAKAADASLPGLSYDLALATVRNEDLDTAASYAADAAKAHPEDLKVIRLQAEIAVKLGHWTEAQQELQQILSAAPDDIASLLELGRSQVALKQFTEAVHTLQLATKKDPTSALAHFYLARAYTGLGNREEAARQNELHRQLSAGTKP